MTVGLFVGAVGFVALATVAVDSTLVPVTVALVLIELGLCAAITVAIDGIISSVPPEKAGAGASVSETGNELGVALGTAVLGSIAIAVYRRQLVDVDAPRLAGDGPGDPRRGPPGGRRPRRGERRRAALGGRPAFVDGMRVASIVAAVLLAAVGLASWRIARRD